MQDRPAVSHCFTALVHRVPVSYNILWRYVNVAFVAL